MLTEEGRTDFFFNIRGKVQAITSELSMNLGLYKFDPLDFKIEHQDIAVPNLPLIFQDYTIVHISDIHYGQWIGEDRLSGVVDLVNQQNPDLIAVTGDFASYMLNDIMKVKMVEHLKRLKPKDAAIAVLGNHDHWIGIEKIREILLKSNIFDISNNVYVVSRSRFKLVFAGVDSVMLHKDRLDLVLEKMPLATPAVLLVHEPDFAVTSATTKRFNLQLSGHSHGGQFVLPLIGTPIRGQLFKKYPLGRYTVDGMTLYTSRGLGTNGYWFRINCPPEITVIHLIGVHNYG